MPAAAAAADARGLDLEEEPQAGEGDQEADRLENGHGALSE
jgi:hypothetical protein